MKGFVTLATGNIHYFYLAYNLYLSYKYRGGKYPFAILCDTENRYTRVCDKVVRLEKTNASYLDKFRILLDSPFDESFFIEPDCLIYRNIDFFWAFIKCGFLGDLLGLLECLDFLLCVELPLFLLISFFINFNLIIKKLYFF